ncbi:Arc family DNA-binding protein [Pseudomonas sp. 7-41]|uniref:Arc family DNA-binding protein n=1 Tax=Pseudomonas sp. 7-41 TaxID=2898483 RepID=UPI001E4EF80E|nr:Arc family DNA-binding protein [Pseudomonas sp. 7-41]UHG99164.1 Arc family DNA-binding protein [Pseudomonas sp. 7-41]
MSTLYPSRTADKFVVRLPDGLRNEVQGAADYLDTSMNTVFVQAVRQYLDNQKRQQQLLDALAKAVTGKEELDAVLHWRGKHTQAIRERDALQQRLTAADERADEWAGLLREAWEYDIGTPLKRKIMAALKPAEGSGDEVAHDRAFRNGLMQGYNLALNGSEKEYQDAVARYSGGKDAE